MRWLTCFLLFIYTNNAYAQDSLVSLSRFERWCTEPGRFVRTEIVRLGNVGNTLVAVVYATDLSDSSGRAVVRISSEWDVFSFVANRNTLYIEPAEMNQALAALRLFQKQFRNDTEGFDVSFTYTTRDDVYLWCRNQNGAAEVTLSRLLRAERSPHMPSMFTFGRLRLGDFIPLMQKAADLTAKSKRPG